MYVLFFLIFGFFLGALVNYAALVLKLVPKWSHPWSISKNPRPFWWKIPVIGWFGMKQEVHRFGHGFWIRPLCIELGMGVFAACFFKFHISEMILLVLDDKIFQNIMLVLFILFGIFIGALANYGAVSWTSKPKQSHPWCESEHSRPFWWKIPVIGWFGMMNEADRFGHGFWIWPLFIELGMGAFSGWFFQSQVMSSIQLVYINQIPITATFAWSLLARCAFQLIFIGLMLCASLIDFDAKIIPDQILINGTLLALVVSFFTPLTINLNPNGTSQILSVNQLLDFPLCRIESGEDLIFPLTATAPNPPLDVFRSDKQGIWGLSTALICWWGWCIAMSDCVFTISQKGWIFFRKRFNIVPSSRRLYNFLKWGTIAIIILWATALPQWLTVWSTLLGMGIAGGFTWLIRIASQFAMDKEAMGFGDVLLMAMFGAFLGWQPCIILFFVAPLAGLIPALLRVIISHDRQIPYGPFLCCGALATMLFWPFFWSLTLPVFQLGPHLITLGLGLLLLMVILLTLINWVEKLLGIN